MLVVADNVNIMNPDIARALDHMIGPPIASLVRQCIAAGAGAIDLNAGPLTRDPEGKMTFFVETVAATTSVPLILDTANPRAMAAGLKAGGRTMVINGVSPAPEKLSWVLPLAQTYNADLIGYLLDADGHVPRQADEMMSAAVALFEACTAHGISPDRLIFDPVVVPVTWPDGRQHNRDILTLVGRLPELLGYPVRTIAGLSNLSSGGGAREKKEILEACYLPMLAAAGLDMVLTNVFHRHTVDTARVCNALLGDAVFSWADINYRS